MSSINSNYQTKSPVLFMIFNRPDVTNLVFEQIKLAKPKRFYIAADGARANKPNEEILCAKTRQIINKIDWDCEVKTLFRDINLGCKNAVSGAIDWFFENEEEGIILEDDCCPSNDFFRFCDLMLEKYRDDTRIRHIGGSNLQNGIKRGDFSYYFSNLTHVWGWASWKRVWNGYDKNISNYSLNDADFAFKTVFEEPILSNSWKDIFVELQNNKIDTWDYQLTIINFFNNSLSIIPNVNLIKNIGFNENATHTFDISNPYANIECSNLEKNITHPKIFLPNKEADLHTLNHDFEVEIKLKKIAKQNKPHRKIKRYIKNLFKIKSSKKN